MKNSVMKTITAVLVVIIVIMIAFSSAFAQAEPGLELQWNLDEGSGTTAIDLQNNFDGTIFNGPSYVPGNKGLGVQLNGIDQYIRSNSPLASLGVTDQPYALSAWVNVDEGVQNGNIVHISNQTTGGGWCIPFLRLEGGVFRATGWDGSQVSAIGTTTVEPGRWYQVLTSWDPDNGLRLFVDGELEDSAVQTEFEAANEPVYFFLGMGTHPLICAEDQGFLKGKVDDARVYSRALDNEDIESIVSNSSVENPSAPQDSDSGTATEGTAELGTLPETGVSNLFIIAIAFAFLITGSLLVKFTRKRLLWSHKN